MISMLFASADVLRLWENITLVNGSVNLKRGTFSKKCFKQKVTDVFLAALVLGGACLLQLLNVLLSKAFPSNKEPAFGNALKGLSDILADSTAELFNKLGVVVLNLLPKLTILFLISLIVFLIIMVKNRKSNNA